MLVNRRVSSSVTVSGWSDFTGRNIGGSSGSSVVACGYEHAPFYLVGMMLVVSSRFFSRFFT